MGATWSKERILGRFRSFRGIHWRGDVSLPQFIDGVVCMGSYRRGDLFGILLIAGFKIRMASVLSGLLLLSFAMGMVTGLGIKAPFDYSVLSAAAAALLLVFWEPDRFTLDKLLNRSRN